MAKERILEWDYLKGILIIFIIFGHTSASLGAFEKDNILSYFSSFTVSFIMPLFLIITGYFIYSENCTFVEYLMKKMKRMIVPAIKWGIIGGIITSIILIFKGNYSLIAICKNFYWNIQYLWYLYAVFVCAIIVFAIEFVLNIIDKGRFISILLYVFVAILLLFVPTDKWNINFSFGFIMIGRLLRKFKFSLNWFYENRTICGLLSIVYFVSLVFFSYEYSVYIEGTNIITNLPVTKHIIIVLFRFLVGILGGISISFISLEIYGYINHGNHFYLTIIKKQLEKLGKYCMEMYCVQFVVVERLFKIIIDIFFSKNIMFTSNPYLCYFVWRNLFGLVLCYITYKIGKWLKSANINNIVF